MAFLKDETVGEGESVPPSTRFTKTWRIQNIGEHLVSLEFQSEVLNIAEQLQHVQYFQRIGAWHHGIPRTCRYYHWACKLMWFCDQQGHSLSGWAHNQFPCSLHSSANRAIWYQTIIGCVPWILAGHFYHRSHVPDGHILGLTTPRIMHMASALTYWDGVTHIWIFKLNNIGSDNGLSPDQCQAIIWTIAGILSICTLGTSVSEILAKFIHFHSQKSIWECCLRNGGNYVSSSMC